mgnify:CR=1 FL=1
MLRIESAFSEGWEKLDDFNWETEKGAFQIFTTHQFFRVDCYGMNGEDMNKFIDVANEFDCPLYDPQVALQLVQSIGSGGSSTVFSVVISIYRRAHQ